MHGKKVLKLSKDEIYELIPQYPDMISKIDLAKKVGVPRAYIDSIINFFDEHYLVGEEDAYLFRCENAFAAM